MDRLIERVSDRLAKKTSRGGFLSNVAKVAAGAAAMAAGLGIGAASADTYCCSGSIIPCPPPPPGSPPTCPTNTHEDDSSSFCCRSGNLYDCIPCRNNSDNSIFCYISFEVGGACPSRRT